MNKEDWKRIKQIREELEDDDQVVWDRNDIEVLMDYIDNDECLDPDSSKAFWELVDNPPPNPARDRTMAAVKKMMDESPKCPTCGADELFSGTKRVVWTLKGDETSKN